MGLWKGMLPLGCQEVDFNQLFSSWSMTITSSERVNKGETRTEEDLAFLPPSPCPLCLPGEL